MEEDIVYKYTEKVIKQIVKKDDEYTRKMIKEYVRTKYPNEKVRIDFYDEETIDKIIDLGINALNSEKTVQKCLHCNEDTPLYCEKCYQELITKNGELQLENEELKNNKKVVANINIALDDMKEYIDGAINNILIENYIPKQAIRDKIELFTKQAEKFGENKCQWTNGGVINLLKEILGE